MIPRNSLITLAYLTVSDFYFSILLFYFFSILLLLFTLSFLIFDCLLFVIHFAIYRSDFLALSKIFDIFIFFLLSFSSMFNHLLLAFPHVCQSLFIVTLDTICSIYTPAAMIFLPSLGILQQPMISRQLSICSHHLPNSSILGKISTMRRLSKMGYFDRELCNYVELLRIIGMTMKKFFQPN